MNESQERREAFRWGLTFIAIGLVAMIAFTVLSYVGVFGERFAFENSFQYKEARKSEIATFEAALEEIKRKLNASNLPDDIRTNLEAEAAAIRIQLQVARSK
jgi:hypothetical protein